MLRAVRHGQNSLVSAQVQSLVTNNCVHPSKHVAPWCKVLLAWIQEGHHKVLLSFLDGSCLCGTVGVGVVRNSAGWTQGGIVQSCGAPWSCFIPTAHSYLRPVLVEPDVSGFTLALEGDGFDASAPSLTP